MTKNRKCTVPGCDAKHHAKGYCKYHYKKIELKQRFENVTCSVAGCTKPVCTEFTAKRLCSMHGTRLMRNGSVDLRRRERDIRSYAEVIANTEDFLNYDIQNQNNFSEIARCFYGDYCHRCGWNEGPCEAHHLTPRSKGGKSSLNNAVVLCPNCHSLEHRSRKKRLSKATAEQVALILKGISK